MRHVGGSGRFIVETMLPKLGIADLVLSGAPIVVSESLKDCRRSLGICGALKSCSFDRRRLPSLLSHDRLRAGNQRR